MNNVENISVYVGAKNKRENIVNTLTAFLVICLTLFVCTVFGIPLYVTEIALALIGLAIAALLLWLEKLQKKTADNVVKADLIE